MRPLTKYLLFIGILILVVVYQQHSFGFLQASNNSGKNVHKVDLLPQAFLKKKPSFTYEQEIISIEEDEEDRTECKKSFSETINSFVFISAPSFNDFSFSGLNQVYISDPVSVFFFKKSACIFFQVFRV
ncbi:MAG: hypothetical protein JST43_12815 [Bacteroidetes bacterium]|nr:hypothetical protein [Bacteroidota bacterium]MBS1541489.1 hypothetical protein [Bacteroidota bacterium]